MLSGSSLWYISRASGVVTLALFTAVVCLGIVTAGRRRPRGRTATVVMGLHRWLPVGTLVFLAVHIVTAIVDGYVTIGWLAVLVPFASRYETLLVGLGTVAVDLLVVILVTSYLRHRIPERAWRAIHWANYALWAFAVVHGIALGTSNQPLLRALSIASSLVVAAFVVWRLVTSHADRSRRVLIASQEWS